MAPSKTARARPCTFSKSEPTKHASRARPYNFASARSVDVSVDGLREVCQQVCRRAAARTPRE
eukprot:2224687-Prymnesium_polylepis.1